MLLTEYRWKHNPTDYRPSAPTSHRVRTDIIVKIVFTGSGLANASTDTTYLKYLSSLRSGSTDTLPWKIHAGGFRLEFREKIKDAPIETQHPWLNEPTSCTILRPLKALVTARDILS